MALKELGPTSMLDLEGIGWFWNSWLWYILALSNTTLLRCARGARISGGWWTSWCLQTWVIPSMPTSPIELPRELPPHPPLELERECSPVLTGPYFLRKCEVETDSCECCEDIVDSSVCCGWKNSVQIVSLFYSWASVPDSQFNKMLNNWTTKKKSRG